MCVRQNEAGWWVVTWWHGVFSSSGGPVVL